MPYWAWNKIVDEFSHLPVSLRRRARRLQRGQCRDCAQPRVSVAYCQRHLEAHRLNQWERVKAELIGGKHVTRRKYVLDGIRLDRKMAKHFKAKGWD